MYKVFLSNKLYEEDFYSILEFVFNDINEATKFMETILDHSTENYTIELTKTKGE